MYDRFGWHTAISGDGKTCVVGSPYTKTAGKETGAAYIYQLIDSNWTETKLVPSQLSDYAYFGRYVSASYDGDTVAVGAPKNTITTSNQGSVHVFKWDGIKWNEKIITDSSPSVKDWFGYSVSLSSDGTKLLIGSRLDDPGKTDQGSAYLYTWDGTGWNKELDLYDSNGNSQDHYGYSVSISGDGYTYRSYCPRSRYFRKIGPGGVLFVLIYRFT